MRSLLFRVSEPLLALAILALAIAAARALPPLADRLTGRPTPDQRLIVAAGGDDPAAFEQALADGASVRARTPDGMTPLMAAASAGRRGQVLRLLSLGADVDAANAAGATPLMLAAGSGHPDTIRLLLRHGADPARRDRTGLTALDIARIHASSAAAAALTHPDCPNP